jgi:DNA-binding MarR family transcriptional regulator
LNSWVYSVDSRGTRHLVQADVAAYVLPHRPRRQRPSRSAGIGFRQALLLYFVRHHGGCSLNAAARAAGYGIPGLLRGAYALEAGGPLDIDTSQRRAYSLTLTRAGQLALEAHRCKYPSPELMECGSPQRELDRMIRQAEAMLPGFAEREALIDAIAPLVRRQIGDFGKRA